jgi:LacI family transcriptional regulator
MSRSVKLKRVRAATLADVGRLAGVSAMAASAVINGARTSSRIPPLTRDRILLAAAKLRYRPNAAARALAQRCMNTLGVAGIVDAGPTGGLNQYFLEIFNGVIECAARHEQNTTVLALHDWERDIYRLAAFCDGRVDGVILVAPMIPDACVSILPEHTPFVSLHSNTRLPSVTDLESDEETGAYEIVHHLVALGHRRILHLSADPVMVGGQRRVHGYRRALADAHIPFDPALMVPTGYDQFRARDVVREWLKTTDRRALPTAVFAANDNVASVCLEEFAEIGLRVPDDISLVGFDDTVAARTMVPQLSTVRQPLREMGAKAVEILLERIRLAHGTEMDESPVTVVFPTQLVLRASADKPAAARLAAVG